MFIIFPNQLYELTNFHGEKEIFLVEESLYFRNKLRDFRINKIKLAYIVACMRYYYDWLKSKKVKVVYINQEELPQFYSLVKTAKKVAMFNPTDTLVEERYRKLRPDVVIMDSPNFIMTLSELDSYRATHPNNTYQQHFFEFVKTKLRVLRGVASLDKYNRNPFPRNFAGISDYVPPNFRDKRHEKYYRAGIEFVERYFSDNPGSTQELARYPITHKQARAAFDAFIKERFNNFGKYEDAISTNSEDPVLFHSCVSAALNMGLLCPRTLVNIVAGLSGNGAQGGGVTGGTRVNLQNAEAYIRQIAGWREYMRFQYTHCWPQLKTKSNVLDNRVRIHDWSRWHNGTTGIEPVDSEIKKAMRFGYAHHIVRLMIFLNTFILYEIDPRDIYRWFMETIAIDAWEWVMISNIYMMGCFVGTKAMRRPYISSSNYIIKMSQYKRGPWCDIWDQKYRDFVRDKSDKPGVGFYRK